MPTKPDISRQKELSVRQANAIDLLLTGKTDSEVAKAVRVTRQTVNGWRNGNPEFMVELSARRVSLWEAQDDRIRDLVPQAVDLLRTKIQDGNLAAAVQLLKSAGFYSGDRRPSRPGDAAEIYARMERDLRPKLMAALDKAGLTEEQLLAVATHLENGDSTEVQH